MQPTKCESLLAAVDTAQQKTSMHDINDHSVEGRQQTEGWIARFINFPVPALPLSAGKESHRSNCLAAKAMFSQIDMNS